MWAFYVNTCLTALFIIVGTLTDVIATLYISSELVSFPSATSIWAFYANAVLTAPSIVDGTVIAWYQHIPSHFPKVNIQPDSGNSMNLSYLYKGCWFSIAAGALIDINTVLGIIL